ncbi:MAG: VWA domain-containing protein [Rhodospirillaceae bacterium]|nr:VWA domain-containing protein [Rhodospirillaceae bacterium]
MSFLAAQMLWFLAAVPVLLAGYVFVLRYRTRVALRYANLGLVKQAQGPGNRLRRHIPPALFLLGLTFLIAALARPAALVTLPSQRETIILSMDVSGSMRASDVSPKRITAAQVAARDFIAEQPPGARIGLVAFSTSAMEMQAPTLNREDLLAAVDRLEPQRFTAVGSGILVALKSIFPDADIDVGGFRGDMRGDAGRQGRNLGGAPLGQAPKAAPEAPLPVAPGSYKNAIIILMSDGSTNAGADPVEAARIAANKGVRVFTVGFGTEGGGVVEFEGRTMQVRLDEDTLKQVADITRGAYFRASSGADLKQIYKTLTTKLVMETQKTEITALFAGVAVVLTAVAALLSMLWFGRLA